MGLWITVLMIGAGDSVEVTRIGRRLKGGPLDWERAGGGRLGGGRLS